MKCVRLRIKDRDSGSVEAENLDKEVYSTRFETMNPGLKIGHRQTLIHADLCASYLRRGTSSPI